ncbi:hypothetical protein U1Q18_050099, partial [Sarracenia purpurea var. burkii]
QSTKGSCNIRPLLLLQHQAKRTSAKTATSDKKAKIPNPFRLESKMEWKAPHNLRNEHKPQQSKMAKTRKAASGSCGQPTELNKQIGCSKRRPSKTNTATPSTVATFSGIATATTKQQTTALQSPLQILQELMITKMLHITHSANYKQQLLASKKHLK